MVGAFLKKFVSCFPRSLKQLRVCRLCRLAAAREDSERVAAIFACSDEAYVCEECCASRFSPGRIQDGETIHFLVTDPQTVDPRSGKLLPSAVLQMHRGGLSVLRDCASNAEFQITFNMLKTSSDAKGKERYWHSVSSPQVRSVRYNANNRCVAVIDTGYKERPAHADIIAPLLERREREKQTKHLLSTMDAHLSAVAVFRGGAFASNARPA